MSGKGKDIMKTNILVQYQGGGYSGCFWEWNYFYIDKQGTFHDIQSSGSVGIDNMQDAQKLLDQDADHTYVYDLNNEQDIIAFSKESHPVHVTGVLQWFEDYNDCEIEFFAVCSACECQITSTDDAIVEEKLLLCYECYSIDSCPCCEYYVGDAEIVKVNPDEHHGFDYICSGCKEYHDEEREKQELEDLRWRAFCTGTPDIFSNELRELWVK